jgi:hypothetical protein
MLREAVASVLAQTYRPIEIVIVDDASDDATPEVIKGLQHRSGGLVHGLRHAHRRGPGASRETGRASTAGEFVQYLDSDDLLAPRKLEHQVQALRSHPECGLAYGDVEEQMVSAGETADGERRRLPVLEHAFPRMLVERVWHTFVPLYRRSLTDVVGPWLPLSHEEDWEYDARAAAMGTSLCKVDEVVGTMRRHGEGHLSGGPIRGRTLADQAVARRHILDHAHRAGVPRDAPEMQHFVRALFLLSRQCGAAGLAEESRQLFELSRAEAVQPGTLDYRGYAAAARMVGWRGAGVLARGFDRLRARSRARMPGGLR